MNDKKYFFGLAFLLICAVIMLVVGTNLSQRKDQLQQQQEIKPVSILDLSPSPKVSPSIAPEPEVITWKTFASDKYQFTVNVPADWQQEDYSSFYPDGGTVIAFSPDSLPCRTCTYFRDGYFSIKLYNQKTDPEHYLAFTQRLASVGKKKDYLQVTIDGKKGVYFSNVVSVEYLGWVYELAFDKDKGQGNAVESKIFQQVLSSFRFTSLNFED